MCLFRSIEHLMPASKIGSGEFYNVYGVNGFHLTAGQKDNEERLAQTEEGLQEFLRNTSITPGVPTQKGQNASPDVTSSAYPNITLGNYDVPSGWPTNVKFSEPGDVPGPPVQFENNDLSEVSAGYGFESDNLKENETYFFHTDHLGSTTYLTDSVGNVCQFVWYAPYGEALVDEHVADYENPFKFSGKELDDITGLYDHGARSRNPVSTLWYGVDPLWEKYPDFSQYNYCAGNPVKFIDPDGRVLWLPIIACGLVIYAYASDYLETGNNNSNTAREIGYLMQNPIDALRVGPANNTDNISSTASNFEINAMKSAGLSYGKPGDYGNAYRHTLWQSLITKMISEEDAIRIGNAHESGPMPNLMQRTFSDLNEADKTIDLLNNHIGRKIGKNHKTASNVELAKLVAKEFYTNGLWTAKKDKDGYHIEKSKITKEQYDNIIQELNKKGENGKNK